MQVTARGDRASCSRGRGHVRLSGYGHPFTYCYDEGQTVVFQYDESDPEDY